MSNNEEGFKLYLEAYQYFTKETNNPELGAKLARDYLTAIHTGIGLANKNVLDLENLKWFFGGKNEW